MNIELKIDGEIKVFTTDIIPMRAKRMYLKIQAEMEKKELEIENYYPTSEEQLREEDEMVGILANVIFGGQFTVDQVYDGAEDAYVYQKLREAIFGEAPPKNEDEGNETGK